MKQVKNSQKNKEMQLVVAEKSRQSCLKGKKRLAIIDLRLVYYILADRNIQ